MIPTLQLGGMGRGFKAPGGGGGGYDAVVLADSPAGFWPLFETSGAVAADISGNGRDGAYVASPTLSASGVTLNGTTQRVNIPSAAFDIIGAPGQDFTLEIWLEAPPNSSTMAIFDKTLISGPADWVTLQTVSSVGHFQLYDGTNNPIATGGGNLMLSLPRYLVAQRDCATNQISYYLDASLVQQSTASGALDLSNAINLNIGAQEAGNRRFFAGKVWRAAVYLTALSGARISAHYAAG